MRMAAKERPAVGIQHVTVVPTNFDPEASRDSDRDEMAEDDQ